MTRAPRGNEAAVLDPSELLEDDDDLDTAVIRLEYDQNMKRLEAKRVDFAKLKRNIPLPDKP